MGDTAYACTSCTNRARGQLAETADMTPAARDIAHGLSWRQSGSGASGKPGSRLPLDLAATAKLDAVQGELGTWARATADERHGRPLTHAGEDPIVHAAHYLEANLEWWRHRPHVDEFLGDVEACARVVRSIARGPAEQKYLGPCGAPVAVTMTDTVTRLAVQTEVDCEGDVYGRVGAQTGTCRTCGATVDQNERRHWLDDEVRGHAFRAAQIAEAYGVNVNTIRSWHGRGQLANHGTDGEGRPLFNVGEVLDLAAADAARREGERAKRARRAAVKAAESEDAA